MLRNLNAPIRSLGTTKVGVPAASVPTTGTHGAAPLKALLDKLPALSSKLLRAMVTRWPTNGTLVVFEDSSFIYTPALDGVESFDLQPYADNASVAELITVTVRSGEAEAGPENYTFTFTVLEAQVVLETLDWTYVPPPEPEPEPEPEPARPMEVSMAAYRDLLLRLIT